MCSNKYVISEYIISILHAISVIAMQWHKRRQLFTLNKQLLIFHIECGQTERQINDLNKHGVLITNGTLSSVCRSPMIDWYRRYLWLAVAAAGNSAATMFCYHAAINSTAISDFHNSLTTILYCFGNPSERTIGRPVKNDHTIGVRLPARSRNNHNVLLNIQLSNPPETTIRWASSVALPLAPAPLSLSASHSFTLLEYVSNGSFAMDCYSIGYVKAVWNDATQISSLMCACVSLCVCAVYSFAKIHARASRIHTAKVQNWHKHRREGAKKPGNMQNKSRTHDRIFWQRVRLRNCCWWVHIISVSLLKMVNFTSNNKQTSEQKNSNNNIRRSSSTKH